MMIKESYDDWNDNPIITTVEEFGTSLNHVDFPTVTICILVSYNNLFRKMKVSMLSA